MQFSNPNSAARPMQLPSNLFSLCVLLIQSAKTTVYSCSLQGFITQSALHPYKKIFIKLKRSKTKEDQKVRYQKQGEISQDTTYSLNGNRRSAGASPGSSAVCKPYSSLYSRAG